MIKVNEYFAGTVKSLSFENSQGKFTAGVMIKGEYEFGTSTPEWMTLVKGKWTLQLPGEQSKNYAEGETCSIPSGIKFKVVCSEDSAYLCRYE